jgi:AcrR family transcriptional regulator
VATNNDLRTPFFDAAFEILGSHGYGGLKLAPLCKAVGVTTGAFYHSFSSWRDFTSQLLEHWHEERTSRLVELARQLPHPVDQLENLVRASIALPHEAEAAIRVWAAIDPAVAKLQESVDRERFDVIYQAFLVLLGDEEEATAHSRAGMFLLIGFEQADSMRDPKSLEWALRLLKQTATDRFHERSSS